MPSFTERFYTHSASGYVPSILRELLIHDLDMMGGDMMLGTTDSLYHWRGGGTEASGHHHTSREIVVSARKNDGKLVENISS